jgi:phosphoglycerate dehydrogenase-like enzyme
MKLLILLHHRFELWQAPAWFAGRLRQEFPGVEVAQRDRYEGAEEELRDADILITWSLRAEQFAVARRLRWIHSPAAAVHLLMIPEVIASPVVVTNARAVHGPVVAEHAIALLLALAKRLPSGVRFQGKHVWAQTQLWRETPRPREVAGATLGLVGLGSIGREVARRAAALSMRVLAVREHPEKGMEGVVAGESAAHAVFGPAELDRVLAESDYVVLAAPLTAKTEALIDAARLAHMKPDAYLINVSRGPLVDEAALAEALRRRRIGGAALDVFSDEPLPPESPLWELDNVLITPHSAAMTEKLWERHLAQVTENLRRFLAGQPLVGVVDKTRGY